MANYSREAIKQIAQTPQWLRSAVQGLSDPQLDTVYRPRGWTVRQVVHHVADSHMNAYIRIRLALTEDNPTIKPYNEKTWAELPDARSYPVAVSLELVETMHSRLVALLECIPESDFGRTFIHPERGPMRLDATLALYAWHGRHHAAHITGLRERMGWK
jgi:uncharacterized damage-inducible protein DinB